MAHIRVCFVFALLLGCALGENEVENDDQYDAGFEEFGENDPKPCVLAENCQNVVFPVIQNSFPDETFLLDHCDLMVKMVQCRINNNETCPVPDIYSRPLKGYDALKTFVVDLCNKESSFRKSYLKEVDCLNSHIEDLKRDMRRDKHFKLLQKFMEHHNLENIHEDKDLVITIRCARDLFRQLELQKLFQSYCGEDAAALFATARDRLFDFYGPPCSGHADDVQHYLNLLKEYKDQLDMPLLDSVE